MFWRGFLDLLLLFRIQRNGFFCSRRWFGLFNCQGLLGCWLGCCLGDFFWSSRRLGRLFTRRGRLGTRFWGRRRGSWPWSRRGGLFNRLFHRAKEFYSIYLLLFPVRIYEIRTEYRQDQYNKVKGHSNEDACTPLLHFTACER